MNADFSTNNGRTLVEIGLLHCVITEPTRITLKSESCLDQIITNIPDSVISYSVNPPFSNNDHCTVAVILNLKNVKGSVVYRHIFIR